MAVSSDKDSEFFTADQWETLCGKVLEKFICSKRMEKLEPEEKELIISLLNEIKKPKRIQNKRNRI